VRQELASAASAVVSEALLCPPSVRTVRPADAAAKKRCCHFHAASEQESHRRVSVSLTPRGIAAACRARFAPGVMRRDAAAEAQRVRQRAAAKSAGAVCLRWRLRARSACAAMPFTHDITVVRYSYLMAPGVAACFC